MNYQPFIVYGYDYSYYIKFYNDSVYKSGVLSLHALCFPGSRGFKSINTQVPEVFVSLKFTLLAECPISLNLTA